MEMEERMFKVYASGDEKIQLKVIPCHGSSENFA